MGQFLVEISCAAGSVLNGNQQPGTIWSEVRLSERVGIGRTPTREALQRLAADNLVVLFRRHGVMITNVNPHEQLLVLESRGALDRLVSVCAARRANDEEREELRQRAAHLRIAGDKKDVLGHLRYHLSLRQFTAKCARNPFAARALAPLQAFSRRFYFVHRDRFDLKTVAEQHAVLADAIASGDGEGAAAASDAMVEYSSDIALKCLS